MTVAVFGIRHHGPGSARSLLAALDDLRADCVLIEGPADGTELIALAAAEGTEPPVALLAYADKEPADCVFYPFASFSPEWQAIGWALRADVPARFIDLPAAEVLAHERARRERLESDAEPSAVGPEERLRADPLALLAQAAGYDDPERWWEDTVEHRGGAGRMTFAGVTEAMGVLRSELGDAAERDPADAAHEARREAFMRAQIRAAEDEGFARVAVVCGAWHAPVLAADGAARAPKPVRTTKTQLTWVPWTHDRLATASGYGAGVSSPGWYEHLFEVAEQPLVHWLARVGEVLREQDAGISTAHVIEAARTAQTLAALRGRPLAGLPEINDALGAVLGEDADALLTLLRDRLIIGERLGRVSDAVPTVPLQRDLEDQQRSLRLKPSATVKELGLDLRKAGDLRRSHLLHRLALLGLPWGHLGRVTGARGTFREAWTLLWQPEFAVRVVEASGWGPTVALAATARVSDLARRADDLTVLTELLEAGLLGDLPDAVRVVLTHFEAQAALSSDVPAMMAGVPPLARAARYGSVRQTDAESVLGVLRELVVRVSVGLPAATAALDDDAAAELARHVDEVEGALDTVADPDLIAPWRDALRRCADRGDAHRLVAGRACRLLRDAGVLEAGDVARRMDLALSRATPALEAAAWLAGFLAGSGLAVIHDRTLLGLVDAWLTGAGAEEFETVLPIMRRTFGGFSQPERRQIGERVRGGAGAGPAAGAAAEELDQERAALVEPVLRALLGVDG